MNPEVLAHSHGDDESSHLAGYVVPRVYQIGFGWYRLAFAPRFTNGGLSECWRFDLSHIWHGGRRVYKIYGH